MHIREIQAKIKSIGTTRKITRAMEMLARAKAPAARKRAGSFRPYAEHMRAIALHMQAANPEFVSPFLRQQVPVRRVGLIVVSTDRGLCGPLNSRLLLQCVDRLAAWDRDGVAARVSVVGARGMAPLARCGADVVAHSGALSQELHFESFFGTISVPLGEFLQGELDEVHIAYNRTTHVPAFEPRIDRILPLDALLHPPGNGAAPTPDYLYEPDAGAVIETLLLRYVEAFVYQAVAENSACEQYARMMAMHTATENADRLIRDLTRVYQKTRQAQITTELCEIIAGAAAL